MPVWLDYVNIIGVNYSPSAPVGRWEFYQLSLKGLSDRRARDHRVAITFLNNSKIMVPEITHVVAPLANLHYRDTRRLRCGDRNFGTSFLTG